MAESKFLRFQDLDRDGLIDVCDDVIEAEEVPCKQPCTPNPLAIIPDWKNRNETASRLNEKFCLYELTKVTPYTTTCSQSAMEQAEQGDDGPSQNELRQKFEEYKMEVAEQLLMDNERLVNPNTLELVSNNLIYAKWDIAARPNSRLKLLYQCPFDIIFNIPDEAPEPEDDEDEVPGQISVKYNASHMINDMLRVRKGLNFYGRMLKVYRAIGEGNAYFVKDRTVFNLDLYGDSAFFDSGILSDMMDYLEGFLDSKGLRLPGEFFGFLSGDEKVTKLKFYFDDYRLVKLKAWTVECGNHPRVYGKRKLKAFNHSNSPWFDRTAVAYFAQLPQMATGLNARQQIPWTEFVEKYTYPKVFFDVKEENTTKTVGSCINDALAAEFKDLGQDILDDVFSLGDAVAYMFRDAVCRGDIQDSIKDEKLIGTTMGPDGPDKTKIFAMAQEQQYKKLETSDNVFVILCMGVLSSSTQWGPLKNKLGDLYKFGIFRVKECGLIDLLLSAVNCLTNGMGLDEAVSTMLASALKAMNIENLGELFVGLPPDKQAEIDALVKKQLEDGEFFQSLGVIAKPWEMQEIIDKERDDRIEGSYEGTSVPASSQAYAPPARFVSERSVMSSYDAGIGSADDIPVDNILQAYLKAIVEVYSDNLLELVDELNKFPGAQIITGMLQFLDCPHPPFMSPSIMDFIKDLTLPFCRNMNEFRTTRWMFENPMQYFADFADITAKLWDLAKWIIMQVIAIIIFNIMIKLCEILGKAICGAIRSGGAIIASLPDLMTGRANLADVIKESICGPEADDQQVDDTILDMLAQMGLGAEAYADRETTLQFGIDLSSSVTQREMSEALLGNPSAAFLEAADQLLEFEYPQFRESMPNKRQIGKFFSNIGNLTPLAYRAKLEEFLDLDIPEDLPANPSLCASPQQIEEFREMRAKLLEGRTTPKQAHQLFCDFKEENMQDLADLSDLLQGGFPAAFADQMPPMVSEPGCTDGIIPYESTQAAAVNMQAMGGQLDSLKIAYIEDMLGNGSFWNSDSSWGFINMIMSDTMGNPLTAHHRKAFNNKSYVNFATNLKNGGESTSGFFTIFQSSAGFSSQEGQFPYYIAEWLMRQFANAGNPEADYVVKPGYYTVNSMGTDLRDGNINFISNNFARGKKRHYVDFEDLQYNNFFGSLTQGINLFMIPDFGYNTTVQVNEASEKVVITREIRKGSRSSGDSSHHKRDGADVSLDFRDNAAGMRKGGKGKFSGGPNGSYSGYISSNDGNGKDGGGWGSTSTEWSYGFDLKCYYHDIYEEPNSGRVLNRFDDNIRVELVEKLNWGSAHIGPLGEALEDDFLKVPPFDLPNWIEGIPIVGWALEAMINLILYPFTNIIGRAIAKAIMRGTERVLRVREFEFLSVDDGLDIFNKPIDIVPNTSPDSCTLADFPKFSSILRELPPVSPPVLMLADFTGGRSPGVCAVEYDSVMSSLYRTICREIGTNKSGFLYGANYDFLVKDDIDYGIIENGRFIPYYAYKIDGREIEESDMILGVSRDVYNNGDNARVIYLDPKIFGGSYTKPALYVKPNKHDGWYGYVNVLFPEYTPCKPHNQDLIDFDELKGWVNKYYPNLPEDPRLTAGSEECTREVPFKRILNRQAKISMYVLILASIRIYASTHIFKAIPVFSKIMPKFPDNFSTIYSAYIVERMEEDFKDAQGAFWEAFTTFKDEEFWYAFLEQSVECYDFLVEAGAIPAPAEGGHLQESFDTINNLQTDYPFTYRPTTSRKFRRSDGVNVKQTVLGMHDKKVAGEAGWFQSLKGIRADENLEAVQSVEEHAKLILMQLVNHELSVMGEKMVKNMRQHGFNPDIFDLDYYILSTLCKGSSLQFAGPDIIEVPVGLPTPDNPDPKGQGVSFPGPYYTDGGEFRVAYNLDTNNEYDYADEFVGYYHGHIDEVGDVIYMAGEYHNQDPDEPQDILTPVDRIVSIVTEGHKLVTQDEEAMVSYSAAEHGEENPMPGEEQSAPDATQFTGGRVVPEQVPLGDVAEYGTYAEASDPPPPPGSLAVPYALEKYVSINGQKMAPSKALSVIRNSENQEARLSDYWPGTMRVITDEDGYEIGIDGQMGVRFGLQFYYTGGGDSHPITSVEVDALDVKISQFNTNITNSKLLFCLVNLLKNDPRYKLMTSYIFSIKKVTGTLAIYSDMALLSSIGEVTPGNGDNYSWLPTSEFFGAIPGMDKFIASPTDKKDWLNKTGFAQVRVKPGSRAYIHRTEKEFEIKNETPPSLFQPFGSDDPIEGTLVDFNMKKSGVTGNEGWAHYYDRQPGFFGGLWVCEWDNWDRILLRNSKSRIKRMFKSYYYSRDFQPGDKLLGAEDDPVSLLAKSLKGLMFPNSARGMLPWWQRGRLRSNPYNAKGGLCDGKN
tara:strand:+ start:227 stop:7372 length:7146 start_codon:yes stop_codon:yes gene_type:complete